MTPSAVVRKPLRARPTSHRTLGERLALRIPALARASTRLLGRLRPGSRSRRELISRMYRAAAEAANRGDHDVLLVARDPDYEIYPPHDVVAAGFAARCYHGPDGYRDWVQSWTDVWGEDVRFEPSELIDLGDRILMLGSVRARGKGSGVPVSWEFASVSTLRDGRPMRDDIYSDHGEALAAVGLEP